MIVEAAVFLSGASLAAAIVLRACVTCGAQ